jgi:hypothetical protein
VFECWVSEQHILLDWDTGQEWDWLPMVLGSEENVLWLEQGIFGWNRHELEPTSSTKPNQTKQTPTGRV